MDIKMALETMTEISARLLNACKKKAYNGTMIFTPDGVGNYDALWVRDFAYMTEYCGDIMENGDIKRCIEFIMDGQRDDGWFPDRVEASGEAVYAAGAKGSPVGEANLDNTPFLVYAIYFYLKKLDFNESKRLFCEWKDRIIKGMDCIPIGKTGLVFNESEKPHSPYGFTDTVCKEGNLYIESLLYWRACRFLSELFAEYCGNTEKSAEYDKKATAIEKEIYSLYDSKSGMFFAADKVCRQIDIWGALYMLFIGFPINKQCYETVCSWLLSNKTRYIYKGQICQLPDGEPWEKLLIDVAPGEYQNGAFWATASGWALQFFIKHDRSFVDKMLDEMLDDFQKDGICECINRNYRKLPEFVVSAANVRGGLLCN